MSLQAITDIIVNPQQLQDLQLSNAVIDSPKTNSNISFSEMLNSVRSEKNTEQKPVSEKSNEPVQETKTVEKSEEIAKADETEKTEKSDITDKTEKKSELKTEKKDFANQKVEVKSDEKKAVKEIVKEKQSDDEKILTPKDFARLNQLTEKEEFEEETINSAVLSVENIKSEAKIQTVETKKEAVEVDFSETHVENQISMKIVDANEMENESSEFNFNENRNDKQKTSFDKEGKITVQDIRTQPSEEVKLENKSELKITDIKQTSENSAQITIDLNQNVNADVLSLNTQSAAADGSNFQAMLNNQIQNNAPEFVKAGNLVLKDNNQGTIDLVLHPDDLGNVKIHLSLDGKTISGQITVNTKEALQVFKDNAETLREAFIKNGFDGASFDVAFNTNSGSSNQNFAFEQQNDGTNLLGKKVYGNNIDSISEGTGTEYLKDEDYSNYSVNIVA